MLLRGRWRRARTWPGCVAVVALLREGGRLKPVTHPRHRANLLQHARKLRFEGARVRNSVGDQIADRTGVAFGSLSLAESARVWIEERSAYEEWHVYAAEILEAGAGGVEPLDGAVGDADRGWREDVNESASSDQLRRAPTTVDASTELATPTDGREATSTTSGR